MARGLYTRKFALDEPPAFRKHHFRGTRHYGTLYTAIASALRRQRMLPKGLRVAPTTVYNLRTGKTVAFIYKKSVEIVE